MKILLYSHFFTPETGAAVTRMWYFYRVLREFSPEIQIISPKPNYPFGKVLKDFENHIPEEVRKSVRYLPIYLPKNKTPISRMLSYLSYFFSSIFYSFFFIKNVDLIITSSPPIITAFAAKIVSKLKNSAFILDIRDIWPDIGIELGIIKNPLAVKGLKFIEKNLLNSADYIFVTATGDKLNLMNKDIPPDIISVVRNGADTKTFVPKNKNEKNEIRLHYKLPPHLKILIYFGSFNHGMNDTNLLADSLIYLSAKDSNFFFVALGEGSNARSFFERIKKVVKFAHFPSLSNSEVATLVAASDISLIPRKKINRDTGGNIPVKCFESWAAGIPVVMSSEKNTEVSQIFNKCESGKLVIPGDYKLFAQSVEELMGLENLDELGLKGRQLVEKEFDRLEQTQKIITTITNISHN